MFIGEDDFMWLVFSNNDVLVELSWACELLTFPNKNVFIGFLFSNNDVLVEISWSYDLLNALLSKIDLLLISNIDFFSKND